MRNVILSGVEAWYRQWPYGKYESHSDYLPRPLFLHMRPVTGVRTNIFYNWAKEFVKKTEPFFAEGKKDLVEFG